MLKETLDDRSTARAFEGHQQRLHTISHQNPRPNNTNSWLRNKPAYLHLTQNAKGAQLQGERQGAIGRENLVLLRKIALTEASMDPTVGTWEFSPGVRLNRFQVPVIDHVLSVSPKTPQRGSNRGARRRELESITRENFRIVQRIQQCTPSERIRLDALRRHAAQHERYQNNIRQPKLGPSFRLPLPHAGSPPWLDPRHWPERRHQQQRSPPSPSEQMPRRVFTPAHVFAPFERRGDPVPSALLRDAAEGSASVCTVQAMAPRVHAQA